MSSSSTVIWWIRRDLRLADNQALAAARQAGDNVLPVFVADPRLIHSPYSNERRWAFLLAGLRALDADLRARGSRVIFCAGDPVAVLPDLVQRTGAVAVYAEADGSPYARRRDEAAGQRLPLLHFTDGVTALPLGSVRKANGAPYVVYSPYKRQWLEQRQPTREEIIPAPETIHTESALSGAIPHSPTLPDDLPFAAGEAAALDRLTAFVMGDDAPIYHYKDLRDLPADPGTSQLSPYLRFGMISARQAVVSAWNAIHTAPHKAARASAETWLSEFIWRDFYITILHDFPQVRRGSFRPKYDRVAWENDESHFAAWKSGQTGYPIVDAAMRQMAATGWMHNRARMIVASFLVKDLLIDWRWGERWFMQQLVDGDPAANNGGWQWSAGTGASAAPYFRIFNPTAQGEKYDPTGSYIRHWLPELRAVPDEYIHNPDQLPKAMQARVECLIGQDYPAPIVDHAVMRERTLAAFKTIKEEMA